MSAPHVAPLAADLQPALQRVLDSGTPFDRAFVVGGWVRDALLGRASKDLDVEVYGVDYDALAAALARFGATDVVGRSFGVVKLRLPDGDEVDFGVPRRDSKVGAGHRGFAVAPEPALDMAVASARRDFTVNALAWDPRRREVLDHHGGLDDLAARVLRHTSAAFVEDPLRVLRGMQLAARLDFTVADATVALARSMAGAQRELPRERVWAEWRKWAAHAVRPSAGLAFLAASGWRAHHAELEALAKTPQDPLWHPEGDVWTHTLHAADAMAADPMWRGADADARTAWMLAELLHDTGKPERTTREVRGGAERTVSPGHEVAGVPRALAFLERIGAPAWVGARVGPLVSQHMAHFQAVTPRAVRRLARRLEPETIAGLAVVIRADAAGRPPASPEPPASLAELLRIADELRLAHEAPRPLLLGRHLLARGWTPGPALGELLAEAFEAQLDGAFEDVDGALAWLDSRGDSPRA